jgi:hypothetical protein
VYVSEAYGLRISRPAEDWIFYAESSDKALFQLTILPKGSAGVPSVVVYVSDAKGSTDPKLAREIAAKKLEERGLKDLERGEAVVAKEKAPTVRGVLEIAGVGKVDVRCLERIEHGFVYTLQCVRGVDDAAADARIDAVVASLELVEPKPVVESAETKTWRALAAKCASDLPWAASWSEASARAKAEEKLVLVVFQNYAPLAIPNTLRTGVLADPDVAGLVRERCIVMELSKEGEAPFRDPRVFGMGKHSFGTDFLFVEPDGKVVADCGFQDASYFGAFARGVLGARTSKGSTLATLERERKGEAALAEIARSRSTAAPEELPALAVAEARIRMRMHGFAEAREGFEKVVATWPENAAADEATFWLGALDVASVGVALGTGRWKKLVDARPASPWSWKASANLAGEGAFVLGGERLDWPEEDLVACATAPAAAPLGADELPRAERDAIAWLVAHQRADGSWWNPMDGFSLGANLYTPACSAICAEALLAHLEADGARNGVERMLDYGLDLERTRKLEPGTDVAGVYSIWNRTFVAWTFARALRAKVGKAEDLAPALQRLVDSVLASQDARGGWPYVQLGGAPAGSGIDPSATFLTAGVALALRDARESGAKVPQDALDHALDFLDRAREKDGTYRYMPDVPGTIVDGTHPEACGRGPVCAYALRRCGRAGLELVASALRVFIEHRPGFLAEWGKTLCHTGPEGFGAHYLFYDYLFAARSIRELPQGGRAKYRGPILADVLAARRADGSFLDFPGLGRPYSTAMAALALRELRE